MRYVRLSGDVAIWRATAATPPREDGFGDTIHTLGARGPTSASTASSLPAIASQENVVARMRAARAASARADDAASAWIACASAAGSPGGTMRPPAPTRSGTPGTDVAIAGTPWA